MNNILLGEQGKLLTGVLKYSIKPAFNLHSFLSKFFNNVNRVFWKTGCYNVNAILGSIFPHFVWSCKACNLQLEFEDNDVLRKIHSDTG